MFLSKKNSIVDTLLSFTLLHVYYDILLLGMFHLINVIIIVVTLSILGTLLLGWGDISHLIQNVVIPLLLFLTAAHSAANVHEVMISVYLRCLLDLTSK